jgi:copper(I)-binding protein
MKWALLILVLGAAQAATPNQLFQAGTIQVGDVRAAPTPPVSKVGAVYLWITNHGSQSDRLIGLDSPVAAQVELHRSAMAQGVMQMRQVASLECPPHATVNIEPGAYHIMLVGLKQPLVAGTTFPLSLQFRDAGMLVVQVSVRALDGPE